MKKLFDYEGPVMQFLIKTTDLFLISVITWILSIPIITIGAANTAKYYVAMKIVRNESPAAIKDYFKAFKENFAQSTKIWLIFLTLIIFLCFDWSYVYLYGFKNVPLWLLTLMAIMTLMLMLINSNIFAIVARFDVKGKEVFKLSVMVTFARIYFWIASVVLIIIVLLLAYAYLSWLPLVLFCGLAAITFVHAFFLVKTFNYLETPPEDEENK